MLVHGAFVDGSGWQGVYGHLAADGYRVAIAQNGSGRHLVTVTMKSKLPAARFAVYVRMCLRGVRILPG